MNAKPTLTLDSLRKSSASQAAITTPMRLALREVAFSNRRLIAPRRLDAIASEEAATFLEFLETGDERVVHERGRRLACEGLGHSSVLIMTEALRSFCRKSVNPGDEVAGRYVNALLESYMAGRESALLQEQERTREAYLRARARDWPEGN